MTRKLYLANCMLCYKEAADQAPDCSAEDQGDQSAAHQKTLLQQVTLLE